MDNIRAEFKIIGLVQGVGFRYFVHRHASGLGLTGYAKNIYDGSVEVLVEGTRSDIDSLYTQLKIGPSRSHVSSVSAIYSEYTGNFRNFYIH